MLNNEKLVDFNTVTRLGRLDAFFQGGGDCESTFFQLDLDLFKAIILYLPIF